MMNQNAVLDSFIKSYTDKPYQYPTLVRHQGTVIAFAMDDQRRIYYSVLNLNAQKDNSLDVNFWSERPRELEFPKEIAEVGFGITDQLLLSTVKKGSQHPVEPGTPVDENEVDQFLSRTARLTANAPFQVISDGRFVYVFRQAIAANHPDQVTVLGPNGQLVPIVDSTLLVDRFVLSGASMSSTPQDGQSAPEPELKLKMEVRFRRSRSKTRPQSTKDSLGARDMEDHPFFEPTQEISFIRHLQDGRFSVLQLPTSVAEISRWQIFAFNSRTGMIDTYNMERSLEGLFNTRGTQATTSAGSAETALNFEQPTDHISLGAGVRLGDRFSQEAWIFPDVTAQTPGSELEQSLLGANQKTATAPPSIWIVNNRHIRVGYGDGQAFHSFLTGDVLRSNQWNHLAVVFGEEDEQSGYQIYVNGLAVEVRAESEATPGQPGNTAITFIGAPANSFFGKVDEVRLWNRSRSEREIRTDKNLRLTGQEPGLMAYWRLDEGSGQQVFDQTGHHEPGTLQMGQAPWVKSDAPVGENAGVNRDSFRFDGRTVESGITSLLYFQQEDARTGYDQQAKPIKKGARVMLAVATKTMQGDRREIATLDFGVSSGGKLAKIPDNVPLKLVEVQRDGEAVDVNAELNKIQDLQTKIAQQSQRVVNLTYEIDYLNRIHTILDDAIAGQPIVANPPQGSLDARQLPQKLNKLQELRHRVASGQREIDQLDEILRNAEIQVFEHARYGGRSLSFSRGSVTYTQLSNRNFNDIISSIRILEFLTLIKQPPVRISIPILRVTVYEHANQNASQKGFAHTFDSSADYVGDSRNDRISSMRIEENSRFADYRGQVQAEFNTAASDLNRLLTELSNIRTEVNISRRSQEQERAQVEQSLASDRVILQGLQSLLNNGVAVPMALLHTDAAGLAIAGGLLKFAWTNDTPLLFDSATGNLALYFRGTDDQFFAAYYQTLTQRAQYPITDQNAKETVAGFARSTEPEMDRITLEISGNEAAETCQVTIAFNLNDGLNDGGEGDRRNTTETWNQIPREPRAFARVLNGLAGDRTFVGRATINSEGGRVDTLTFAETGVNRSLPAGATLIIGDIKATLRQAVSQGATLLPISSTAVNPSAETLPVFFLEYDYSLHAHTTQSDANLENGSRLLAFLSTGVGGAVKNQVVNSGVTLSCQWVAAAPGHTLTFRGDTAHAALRRSTNEAFAQALKQLAPKRDLTLEAWIRPNRIDPSVRRSRVIHLQPQTSQETGYLLGLKAETLQTAIALNGASDFVRIRNAAHLSFAGKITLEAWVKPLPNGRLSNIIVHGNDNRRRPQVFLRINQGNYEVGVNNGTDHKVSVPLPSGDQSDVWVHLAGVYDGTHWRLYRNGVQMGAQADPVGAVPVDLDWGIGSHPSPSGSMFKGAIAEVRIWRRDRSPEEIATDMDRQLVGNETDLVGYWRFDDPNNNRATDYSRYGNHGNLSGNPQPTESPIPGYSIFAGVANQMVQASEVIAGGNWNHLAVVFQQAYGIQFNGQPTAYLDAGKDATLDLNRDLTIEVFFQATDLSQPRSLLTKGKIDATENPEQYVPYALYITPSGRLVFAFEDVNGNNHTFVTQSIPDPRAFHKVTVTRKYQTRTNRVENSQGNQTGVDVVSWFDIQFYVDDRPLGSKFEYKEIGSNTSGGTRTESNNSDGRTWQPPNIGSSTDPLEFGSGFAFAGFKLEPGKQDTINGIAMSQYALAVDQGRLSNPEQATALAQMCDIEASRAQLASDSNLRGQLQRVLNKGMAIAPMQGIISEIRLWSAALEQSNLVADLKGSEEGLLSWWRFEEAEGTIAFDSKGTNHAKLKGALTWAKDPNPDGSKLGLYHNGELMRTTPIPQSDRAVLRSPTPQFTLGGVQQTKLEESFQGDLEEVRIWQVARTQEQIQDNLFRRLMGSGQAQFLDKREHLLAYYPFDTEKDNILSDYSLQGIDLTTVDTRYTLSTAPISEDTPQVRSALAGLRTPFNDLIYSTPAVQEYGDLQTDIDGNLFGVFKRCYGFTQDGEWRLITGFKVGDLVTEWIGQVQFDPQIIGFIEGAPPVPGENLTSTGVVLGEFADYNGASAVALKQADKTTFTYSADRDSGFDLTFDLTVGLLTKTTTSAGLGLVTEVADANGAFGLKTKFEHALGWLEGGSTSTALSTNLSSQQQLQGFVEPPDQVAFTDVGRRFIPENMGFALVQSQTADVFALRLKHNSALVSYQIRPNPDIPPDRNIINFPLNPVYTKQGTLDGKVGFSPDPSYPNALTFNSDSSFYKPVEAFTIKQRIQREEERIKAYYEQYDAGSLGRRQNATHFQSGDLGTGSIVDQLPRLSKRNLANTYVWTTDGGLFAETQETLDVVQETSGGSYSFKGLAGGFADLSLAIAGVGVKFGMELMLGGHLNVQATKSQESETGFSLDVNVDKVERDVFLRDAAGNVLFDNSNPLAPKALRQPGKVDAYRFMTFYLEPQPDHFDWFFDRVVDPIWLEQSDEANAIALRGLRDTHKTSEKKPPCWRIMHRVTFVSRVLPPVGSLKPLPALESKMRELSIDSNFELIKRLDPFVADKVDNFGEFSRAIREAIELYMPELQPHIPTITEFMLLFYGVVEDTSVPDSPELTALLETGDRAPNRPPMVRAGRTQHLQLEGNRVQALLQGAVADDRLTPDAIFVTWAVKEAPQDAVVTFDDAHAVVTTAMLSKIGRYVLTLTASDGVFTATDEMSIVVNQSPLVSAGNDREVEFGEPVELRGELLRDGRGDRANQTLTTRWEAINSPRSDTPHSVSFENPDALSTVVRFSKSGVHLLRLTATTTTQGGTFTHSDDLQIIVGARIKRGLQTLYSFAEAGGATVRDVAAVGVPADLTLEDETAVLWLPDALKLKEPVRLINRNASRLMEAMKSTHELTMEAWISPAQVNQTGLARILTLSDGPGSRNFILGQVGNQFHVGIRTSETNLNASDRALAAGPVTLNSLTHVVCTREATGVTRLYINGQEVANRLISGNFSNWDDSFSLVLGNELGNSTARDRAWLGTFHLVALYSRALSPQEVRTNFEVGADVNLAPVISVGSDRVVNLPGTVTLTGVVTDDRLLAQELSVLWSQPTGPVPVSFSNPESLETTVTFDVSGVYILRLTVSDGEQTVSDDVQIVVNQAPRLSPPIDLIVQLPNSVRLNTQVQSGLGDERQGQLTVNWTQASGPGTATFNNPRLVSPTVQFPESGTYVLRLTAHNGQLASAADVVVHVNKAPVIKASADLLVTLPNAATLQGEILDNGLGDPNGAIFTKWTVVNGPGQVNFANANNLITTATFSTSGVYTLRLTVQTGALSTSREVTLTANQAPVVDAGADQTIDFPEAAELDGTVSDDGFPSVPGRVALNWSQVSGPGNVEFSDPGNDFTLARFSQGGEYVLRLTADDGAIATSDQVTIRVNQAPVVDAGANQVLTLPTEVDGTPQTGTPAIATLTGVVQDDGLPTGAALVTNWQQLSGPAPIKLATPNALVTQAEFLQAGSYVFEFSASDGRLIARDQVTVVVSQRIIQGLEALYTFREGQGNTIRDVAGVGQALDLTLVNGAIERLSQGGIVLSRPALLATTGAATRLTQQIQASGSLTVEAWVKPFQVTPTQGTPARIVTLSVDTGQRNITLGQADNQYSARLRTTTNGVNGTNRVIEGGSVKVNQLTHLVYTRDAGGNATLYLDGQPVQRTQIEGDFSNWNPTFRLALGNELTSDRPWLGEYHLVAFYSRALTSQEVAQNFRAQLSA